MISNLLKLFQKDDLKAVVEYLRADGNVSLIGLWGRSMGAVTRLPSTSVFPLVHLLREMNCFTHPTFSLILINLIPMVHLWSGVGLAI